MFMKRLEKGRFVWPSAKDGKVALSHWPLSMLLTGIDWFAPEGTKRPLAAGTSAEPARHRFRQEVQWDKLF